MGWVLIVMVLVAIQVIPPLRPTEVAASLFDGTCDGVECGRGTCKLAGGGEALLGFVCECEPGWTQLRLGDDGGRLRFLPCVIPNCTLNYSCYHDSAPPTALPLHAPPNMSIFDPCFWSYCGGGTCVAASSGFRHSCECKDGFSNPLNMTSLPCFRNCVVGADCPNLGFTLSNASFPSSPPYFTHTGASSAPKRMMWPLFLAVSLAVIRAIS